MGRIRFLSQRALRSMVQIHWDRRLVPVALGAGMLGTVVAAGLAPTIGAVAAQSNCQYGSCTSASSTPFPWWIVAAVLAVVVIAALIGLMLLRRRPPSGTAAPAAWQPPSGASGN
jgi:H+/Cl- antiporter ClcA